MESIEVIIRHSDYAEIISGAKIKTLVSGQLLMPVERRGRSIPAFYCRRVLWVGERGQYSAGKRQLTWTIEGKGKHRPRSASLG